MNPLYEIAWYGLWWLPFVAISFFSARYFGRRGTFFGDVALAIMIYILDSRWVTADMKELRSMAGTQILIFFLAS